MTARPLFEREGKTVTITCGEGREGISRGKLHVHWRDGWEKSTKLDKEAMRKGG